MKALVLGSSGFLGSYLGFRLAQMGWETHGVSRSPAPWFSRNTVVSSADEMSDVIRSEQFGVVINAVAVASHEACENDPNSAFRINGEWPGIWAAVCRDTGSQFVHISTDAVFDGGSEQPYSEGDVAQAPGVYGRSKLAGEVAVLTASAEALVLRTNFFGWSVTGNVGILDFFVTAFEDRRLITGFTDYVVASIYVGHLVEALVEAVATHVSGLRHVVASEGMSKFGFGQAVADEFGLDDSVMKPGRLEEASHLSARGKNLTLSTASLERALGRPMPSCHDGLRAARAERAAVMDYFEVRTTRGVRSED